MIRYENWSSFAQKRHTFFAFGHTLALNGLSSAHVWAYIFILLAYYLTQKWVYCHI